MSGSVDIASPEDDAHALAAALAEAGVTSLDELRAQAEAGEFSSDRARRVWFMVAPLDTPIHLVDP